MEITLDTVKHHMRIDNDDDDGYIETLIETSEIYITSMVGDKYKKDKKAIKLASILQLKIINDLYSSRGTEIQVGTKKDVIVTSILDKLSNF
ncbi:head-tail connector protein [Fusobacterium sp. IOR10]|uniref:head-tail connector protein n=1 Tax=Fusobacterium sp. IOR10 TaxID=2665157 RepID=UPI001940036F|nr:head-tail connector protein [Fusobacterium sp. IOR10]